MKLPNALIGYTGFVGGNILSQQTFDSLYNSKNIEEIREKNFDTVVCAGVPAVKWLANKEPEQDLANISRLMDSLKNISAKKFILISTVDVYPRTFGVDESFSINKEALLPYGKHRRMLEEFVEQIFDYLIVRLPGLFGNGLKKNPLYDLINNKFEYINPDSLLQFYYLNYLWSDINKSLENKIKIINLISEPTSLNEVARECLDLDLPKRVDTVPQPQIYDIYSQYAHTWGNAKPYLYLKDRTLADIKSFVTEYKKNN